ncbi:MAG: hypothetical protein J6P13_02170 [Kiritimatiellae bacterium]|nr:hypothetical protein [Kiritimatiellia bacterium]
MKVALIIVGAIVLVFVAIEVIGKITTRRAKARFGAMSPDEQRKEQERLYKRHQMGT